MSSDVLMGSLGTLALVLPALGAMGIALPWLLRVRLEERVILRITNAVFSLTFLATLAMDAVFLARGGAPVEFLITDWIALPAYTVHSAVLLDAPAALIMTLTGFLAGLIGVFSGNYLHKDPGFHRFFVLLLVFASGMMAVAAGGTLDIIYAGWEIVGLTSALLIAYFTYREAPVRHGLRAFAVYRVCDVALLGAAILVHHHSGALTLLHPDALPPESQLLVGGLLIFASMGKGALLPFTGWLPRAMEGPTPSSAIFYGALSIHAGPFLLLRGWPYLEGLPALRWILGGLGLATALHASMVGRVQSDIKTQLGYASVAQAGVIVIEIAAGFTGVAMIHIFSHAILRAAQLLRAPAVLHDWFGLAARLGRTPTRHEGYVERHLPAGLRRRAYAFALDRWAIDDFGRLGLRQARRLLQSLDRVDQRFAARLAGDPAVAAEPATASPEGGHLVNDQA
ncbi:MAG: hypothetical protein H6702_24085 [Myxococcales bacterium]|nr:hypothetical protein [Myxococcales bacterium]